MALGFSSIGRNGDGAWAEAGPFAHIPIRVECSLLFNGLTSLAWLAGIQPEPGAKSEFSLNQQIERISWLITPKKVGVAMIPLLLPILAPLAYLYIGGLWHGLLSAIPVLGALLIIDSLHYDLQASTAAVIAPFVAWKAYMATETRNNLIAANMVTPKEFNSFHYTIYTMSDLFIGCCMGLGIGICLTLILSRHSIFGDYWVIAIFISAILIIWISELLCEVTFVRMYEKFVGKQNPFFLQYHSRWDRSNQQSTPGEVARFNISQLLPSKKEALIFLLLSIIVTVNMLFNGL